jgi:uncharacterized protein (TIGR03083 family)
MGTPDAVRDAIEDLARQLESIERSQWDIGSLCEGWRIRDVCAHVVAGEQGAFGPGAVLTGMLRHRGDYNRWLASDGRERGRRDPAVILTELRDAAMNRRVQAPKREVRALTHVVVHGQDMCRPLGIRRDIPEADLVAVADFVARSIIFRAKRHLVGLRLVATDIDWSYGNGPSVTGSGEALVMSMAGRRSALADLSGEGADAFRRSFNL